MNKHNAIKCYLQLFISNHKDKDDLLITDKKLGRVFMKNSSQVCKSVIELDNIAIILELYDVREINLNVFIIFRNHRVV